MSIERTRQQEIEILNDTSVIGGSSHPELTSKIAFHMGLQEEPVERRSFPNSESYICLKSVRQRHIFVVQTHNPYIDQDGRLRTVDSAIMEQAMLVGAAKRASAKEITVVVPLLGYARQDKKQQGGEEIAAELPLRFLELMGANRIVTVDVHSSQSMASFRGPFDLLSAQPQLRQAVRHEIRDEDNAECVVVEPDAGSAKRAQGHARELRMSTVAFRKMRANEDSQELTMTLFGDVKGKTCILFDDMVDTAGTVTEASEILQREGAKKTIVAATHGILSGPAIDRIKNSPIDKLIISDTVPTKRAEEALGDKIQVVSFAPVIARALTAIAVGRSVSEIFNNEQFM